MDKLKRAVVKEEYVAITGNMLESIILNQFIYWSERVKDFDKFIKEEHERMIKYSANNKDTKEIQLLHGWIHKTAIDLKDEIMSTDSEKTINRYIANLVDKEFIERRNNPNFKYDRTYQYRVNFPKIIESLSDKGYTLQDYKVNIDSKPLVLDIRQNDACKSQNDACKSQNDACKSQNDGAIPEITTKITTEIEIHTQGKTKSLCVEIQQNISRALKTKIIQDLVKQKGFDVVKRYVVNWDKYRAFAKDVENGQDKWFIHCVQNEREIPVPTPKTTTQSNSTVPQYANFPQRQYDDDYYEKFINKGFNDIDDMKGDYQSD